MEHALTASAGVYYCINITKDIVPGTMYQVIDGREYSINEKTGLPKTAALPMLRNTGARGFLWRSRLLFSIFSAYQISKML